MNTQIIELYINQQMPILEVCKVVKMAPKTVKRILLESGHQIRTKNATRQHNISEDVLRRLYIDENKSCYEISQELGIANGTVHNYLKKFGLNTKSVIEAKSNNHYTLWTSERLEQCRTLLLEHREYQIVADILGCTACAIENKNRENWQIPMSIWVEHNDEIRAYLEKTLNYQQTALYFNLSERALEWKNQKSWHIDLSMNSTCFGIPTNYNGILYRSKKEAIIAQYLTEHNVDFEYERKVVEGYNWTCDFYLPLQDIWIEYDGLEMEREATKSIPYNQDNAKIRYYQQYGYRHMILGKRTWKRQLDQFFGLV